jgi:hypothetical protein
LPFPEVYSLAVLARNQTAEYLRLAILELSNLGVTFINELRSSPYDKPLEAWNPEKHLRGHLVGSTDQLAQAGYEHPWVEHKSSIESITFDESKDYVVKSNEQFTVHVGEGVIFQPKTFEVWGPKKEQ